MIKHDARVQKTGFGSRLYTRANEAACACAEIHGTDLRAHWERLRSGLPILFWYFLLLPSALIELSAEPAGRMIRQHLMIRENGRPRFRRSQGVLWLPHSYDEYLRGRHRQALRTNISRAREAGFEVHSEPLERWAPGPNDLRREYIEPGPSERWWVTDPGGVKVAEAVLTVDRDTAMIQGLVIQAPASDASYARWLLHSAIVQRLCGSCKLLFTNSHEALRMRSGDQYFQRLLGYSIYRLRVRQSLRERLVDVPLGSIALCVIGAAAIVAADAMPRLMPAYGERALLWLAVMTAVRRAANQAGWAFTTGALAGLAIWLLTSRPITVALAYGLAGLAFEGLIGVFPRLARNLGTVALAGGLVTLVTAIAPAFPTLGDHRAGVPWPVPPLAAALFFGGVASALGWRVGGLLTPVARFRPS